MPEISVQNEDFSVAAEYDLLCQEFGAGAVVMFSGRVRDMNLGDKVGGLCLEHYPAMTQSVLEAIVAEARDRWPLNAVRVIHRVGQLHAGDQIVFTGVASAHRGAAFDACEFIMDNLKTRAPFWKKEQTLEGDRWLEARQKDLDAAARWDEQERSADNCCQGTKA
ncbi:molybdopterin synthase catalytic subunit MoaE [Spongorhabdus nitratireducens]